jgi:polysaccharide deacetylase family protein (PEP-CTERM system associated)
MREGDSPATAMPATMGHPIGDPIGAMTLDVEDYFQVEAFAGLVDPGRWDHFAPRVAANTNRTLDLFAAAGVRATCFTLGWVAERNKGLVRRIVAEGHELASHGYGHQRVDRIGEAAFLADIRHAKAMLEDIGGVAVGGYRAPTFSIGPRTPWAFEALAATGHRYSSSVFPIRHDLYGAPDSPRGPHRRGPLLELPMTTLRLGNRNLPLSGGGWFRLAPYTLFRAGLRRVLGDGTRAIFYFHPWEIDPAQPVIPGASAKSRFRHRVNLGAMEGRLRHLLRDFAWDRVDRVFAPELAA